MTFSTILTSLNLSVLFLKHRPIVTTWTGGCRIKDVIMHVNSCCSVTGSVLMGKQALRRPGTHPLSSAPCQQKALGLLFLAAQANGGQSACGNPGEGGGAGARPLGSTSLWLYSFRNQEAGTLPHSHLERWGLRLEQELDPGNPDGQGQYQDAQVGSPWPGPWDARGFVPSGFCFPLSEQV